MQDRVAPQADRLVFTSAFRAECHVAAGRFFGNVHITLGAVAAGLAAGAGATAFASNNVVAGSLAIAAAAVTGVLTSLRPDERSQAHWNAANAFADLANRTYMARLGGETASTARNGQAGDETGSKGGQPAESWPVPNDATAPQAAFVPGDLRPGPLAEIEAFQREFRRLDAAAPPLPGRLTKKGMNAMAAHRTWHPPQYDEFDSWRTEIVSRRRRWRAAPVITSVVPEHVRPGSTVEVWGKFLLPPSPIKPEPDSWKPYATIGGLLAGVEVVRDGHAGVDHLRVAVPVQLAPLADGEQGRDVTLDVYTALGERASGSPKLSLISQVATPPFLDEHA